MKSGNKPMTDTKESKGDCVWVEDTERHTRVCTARYCREHNPKPTTDTKDDCYGVLGDASTCARHGGWLVGRTCSAKPKVTEATYRTRVSTANVKTIRDDSELEPDPVRETIEALCDDILDARAEIERLQRLVKDQGEVIRTHLTECDDV